MTARGIRAVRDHLAKLPPSSSLTLAERRAQYDRAERVFQTPADVAIEVVKTPEWTAEWLTPPGVRTDAVVLYFHGGATRSARHARIAISPPRSRARPEHARCCSTTGWRPRIPSRRRSTTRLRPTS